MVEDNKVHQVWFAQLGHKGDLADLADLADHMEAPTAEVLHQR
jgi:hypothetical protein